MEPIELLARESRGVRRDGYVFEQGIPVLPMAPENVARLAVVDEKGQTQPASIHLEGTDQNGDAAWVYVAFPVSLDKGEEKRFWLKEAERPAGPTLDVRSDGGVITIASASYTLTLTDPGRLRLESPAGLLADGDIFFELQSDARSAVGNQRPVHFEPRGFQIIEQTPERVKTLLFGWYRAWAPKEFHLDARQRYDVELEITCFISSPVIRLQWRITDHMRFNCAYMWLDRYVMGLTLPEGTLDDGAFVSGEEKCFSWAQVSTPGGSLAMAFPLAEWLGPGAGVEWKDGRLVHGGVNPPPDGGFGGEVPDIHRKFFYGMSRTFDASILVNPHADHIQAELNPLPLIVPAQHYSDTKQLPEGPARVDFGPWREEVDRAAQWLIANQWKGTLWFGEWWREWDIDHNLGIEETHSGNSPLGPLYHFYRTGDWRFWQAAKMSFYYTYDCQFCKREDGDGPYMHTRRFMLDHQEWFHPRYQRVGGVIRPSHLFGMLRMREKIFWYLHEWASRYIDEEGAPLLPDGRGGLERATERAMSNSAESLMYAWIETRDSFFLEKGRSIADWIVQSFEGENFAEMAENSNSTRYILRGLIFFCTLLDEQKYRDTYIKIAEWTATAPRFEYGTHYVSFHFYYGALAYKMGAGVKILYDLLDLARWVLSCESTEAPGTYPFPQRNQYPTARWVCSYDNQALAAYLPVLSAICAEAGIQIEAPALTQEAR